MPQLIEILDSGTNEPIMLKTTEITSIASSKDGSLSVINLVNGQFVTTYTPYRDIKALIQKESIRSAVPTQPRS